MYLVEHVEYAAVKPILDNLNPNGANARPPVPKAAQMAKRKVVQGTKELVAQLKPRTRAKRTASLGKPVKEKGVAYDWKSRPGLDIDFQLLSSGNLTNYTFQGNCTYLISGTLTLTGTSQFEAGSVLKYTNAAKVKVTGPVNWQSGARRPIVLTSIDDNSVGDTIRTNTLTGQYADTALDLDANTAGVDFLLQNLRVAYATNGIRIVGRSGHVLSHVQFINCNNALSLTNATAAVRNGLFNNISTVFSGSSATVSGEHLTLNAGTTLNGNTSGLTLTLTNSLITAVRWTQ